ncbi:MAG: carboxypeptidase regulatory-like domain-containing protein [Acidobacteriota bacterium]
MTTLQRAAFGPVVLTAAICFGAFQANAQSDASPVCPGTPACAVSTSQDISGTILIKKKLTKRSVTAPVSIYQRGTVVELGKDEQQDPIAYERSRVVVYLEGPDPNKEPAPRPTGLQMRQINRRFTPDLLVVPAGTSISFPNMDPIFHNIFSLSKPKTFDLGSYDKGATRNVEFPKPGVVYVYCHLHPNMEATVFVTPNRYYVRPDATGHFRIPDVPPGHYTVVAWHKAAGFFRKPLTVEAGHGAVVSFFIPLSADGPKPEADMSAMPGMGAK